MKATLACLANWRGVTDHYNLSATANMHSDNAQPAKSPLEPELSHHAQAGSGAPRLHRSALFACVPHKCFFLRLDVVLNDGRDSA